MKALLSRFDRRDWLYFDILVWGGLAIVAALLAISAAQADVLVQQAYYIRWNSPAGPVDGYTLARYINGGMVSSVNYRENTSQSYLVRDIVQAPPGANVCWTIQAYNVAGPGAISPQQCVTWPPAPSPLPATPAAPPVTVSATPGA